MLTLDLQRRGGVAELPRLAGDLGRVAVLAHRVDFVVARVRDPNEAESIGRGAFADPVRLAGEQRFVHREAARVDNGAVGDQLIAGPILTMSPGRPVGRRLDDAAVADSLPRGATSSASRSSVSLAFGSWRTPIAELTTAIRPKRASANSPSDGIRTKNTAMIR